MAISCEIAVINPPAATGSQSYHPFSFQPKLLLSFTGRATSAATFQANYLEGYGAAYGTLASQMLARDERVTDAGSNTNSAGVDASASTLLASTSCNATLTAFLSDGFTLNWTATPGATGENVVIVGLGGADFTSAFLKSISPITSGSTGNVAYTGVGFHPDLILFFSAASAGRQMLGAADSSAQWSQCWGENLGQLTSLASTRVDTSHCLTMFQNAMANSQAIGVQASLVSMDADGFTLNYNSATDSAGLFPTFSALCLKLANSVTKVGSFTKSTSAAPVTDSVAMSMAPVVVEFVTAGQASTASAITDLIASIGIANASSQYANWGRAKRVLPYVAKKYYENSKAIITGNVSPSTLLAAASASLTTSGADVTWSTNDAVATQVLYWAIGSSSNATGTETSSQAAQTLSASATEVFIGTETGSQPAQDATANGRTGFNTATTQQAAQTLAASAAEVFTGTETSSQAAQDLHARDVWVFTVVTGQHFQGTFATGLVSYVGSATGRSGHPSGRGFGIVITYPLSMPTVGPRSIKLAAVNLVGESVGQFDHIGQYQDWHAEWWEGSLTWPPMKRPNAELVTTWATALRGTLGIFLLKPYACTSPQGNATAGTIIGSVGARLVTLSLNGTLVAGDYFSCVEGGLPRLHKVLEDTDGGDVSIFPALRASVTGAITVVDPAGAFRLAENKRDWSIDEARIFGIAINCKEALEVTV